MKNPWFAFAGICSLVLGIVLFSVVFGGYSSFVRAQKRIEAAKDLMIEQCTDQLNKVRQLADLQETKEPLRTQIMDTVEKAANVLDRMEKINTPLARELILEYEAAQVRVNEVVNIFFQSVTASENHTRKQFEEMETAVFITGKRYNKTARYFNTRTQVFPGFIIARLFGLDNIHFNEITLDRLNPLAEKEVSGAS